MLNLNFLNGALNFAVSIQANSFRSSQLVDYWYLVVLPVLTLVGWVAYPYLKPFLDQKTTVKPAQTTASLFNALCKTHKLSNAEKSLLLNVSSLQKIKKPELLFIDNRPLKKLKGAAAVGNDEYEALYIKLYGKEIDLHSDHEETFEQEDVPANMA